MTKKTFSKILKEMLIPNINKTAEAMSNSAGYKIEQELENLVCKLKENKFEFKEEILLDYLNNLELQAKCRS